MKKIFIVFTALFIGHLSIAQLTTAPDGGNKLSAVSERIGITDVSIHYGRPHVKGREGKIWGQLVPFGFTDLGFGTSKAAPWRAGANENTTIEFSTDVTVEGKPLAAGKYGFFVAVYADKCTLIFSNNSTSWGSFFYNQNEDVLRVDVKQQPLAANTEWLTFSFEDQTSDAAIIALTWEKWKIPFTVKVDLVKTQLESFRRELKSDKGFTYDAWVQAANFCADNNTNLEEGLQWADYGVNGEFIGEKNFQSFSAKARILDLLKRTKEASDLMQQAIPLGSMMELHNYGRMLLSQKRVQAAYDVFKQNYDAHPNTFTTNMGMARGLSAKGNYKEALNYAQAALPQVPDPGNKVNVEKMIETLKAGKDINQ